MNAAALRRSLSTVAAFAAAISTVAIGGQSAFAAPPLPEIRLSSQNAVPRCVTPERLMAFLKQRNRNLDPRFRNIAAFYKRHGEAWAVRWDYAFFQMAIETNFLTYRQPNGRMGDVNPRQNNFAGIGTTGGGVPGDSFPDVSTGVLGQIQHLVVYSGEWVDRPVAQRTALKQQHILDISRKLNRPVRFSDLAKRWAVDPKYANSIEWVASRFRAEYCKGRAAPQEAEVLPWQQRPGRGADATTGKTKKTNAADASRPSKASTPKSDAKPAPEPAPRKVAEVSVMPAPTPAQAAGVTSSSAADHSGERLALFSPAAALSDVTVPNNTRRDEPQDMPVKAPMAVAGASVGGFLVKDKPAFPPPSGLGVKPTRCVVKMARYGGETTVLVKSPEGADVHYIAVSVLDGFEDNMIKNFLASRPEGGEVLGTFPSRDAAVVQARRHCPD